MQNVYVCDVQRTPFGRYAGALSKVRTDDLAAIPIRALMQRHPSLDWGAVDEVLLGCANQAGEDNRNVARMASLLAGLPVEVPAATINRLCGSSLDAVGTAARAIACGEAGVVIAGGVESMSRAPFVVPKAGAAFSREAAIYDTTIGWRFVNPAFEARYGIDSMPETAQTVADEFHIDRGDQDLFALASQTKALLAQSNGTLAEEIVTVEIPQHKGASIAVSVDEHPRSTTLDALAALRGIVRRDGSVTAGNSSGVNDGAVALLLCGESEISRFGVEPLARVVGMATAGVPPRVMGLGPVPSTRKLLARHRLELDDLDVIELNEAFAAQGLAVLRGLGIADNDPRVNPNGGAIAIGHPLGASGARIVGTASRALHRSGGRYALCTMCVGVGQGVSLLLAQP